MRLKASHFQQTKQITISNEALAPTNADNSLQSASTANITQWVSTTHALDVHWQVKWTMEGIPMSYLKHRQITAGEEYMHESN